MFLLHEITENNIFTLRPLPFHFFLFFKALPKLIALQQEHDALNKALRCEQQLYSSLVRTVKEQDR